MDFDRMSREELIGKLRFLMGPPSASQPNASHPGGGNPEALLHELRVHQVELEMQNHELREAQSALEQSRSRFEELYDFAPVAYFTFDAKGGILEANLTAATMVARDRSSLLGMPFLAFVKLYEPSRFWAHLRRCADTRQPVVTELAFSIERDGKHDVQAVSAPVFDPSESVVAYRTSFTDISKLKEMEAQLVGAERLASMGTLAAGLAHEINNPLAVVVANLDLMLPQLQERSRRHEAAEVLCEMLRDAREAADRITAIVRDLKVFTRGEGKRSMAVELMPVIDSTLRLAQNEIRHRACLVVERGVIPPVEADPNRLGQLLLNLVVNAAQAIPEGHRESNEIRVATSLEPSGTVLLEISDTGCGMSDEVKRRLYEPFFTTKSASLGTGLGLAICHRIVHDLGGSIELQSEVNQGTTFRVHLPVARSGVIPTIAAHSTADAPQRRGRVLVVDDEPSIGTAIRRTLTASHEVIVTTSARDALSRMRGGEHFDVILCDVMMPDMTGIELCAELSRLDPCQAERVVLMTGGAFTEKARDFLAVANNARIEKPFDPAQLRALVNERMR